MRWTYLSRAFLGLALSLMFVGSALAETPEKIYQVDFVLYSHLTPERVTSEHWPGPSPAWRVYDHGVRLLPGISPMLQPLPASRLNAAVGRLQRDPNVHVLLHLVWQQAMPLHETTHWHLLSAPERDLLPGWLGGGLTTQVDGAVSLRRDQYITVRYAFKVAVPDANMPSLSGEEADNAYRDAQWFYLKDNRRIKSNELNYFDHPLFGVLLRVDPVGTLNLTTTDKPVPLAGVSN